MKLSLKLLFLPALLFSLAFAGCSGKDDNPVPQGHKIKFKAVFSPGSKITTVIYLDAAGESKTIQGLSVETWESQEISYPASAQAVSFGAIGPAANAQATGKVQIIVDGVVKKESTATGGAVLNASATYYF